MCICRGTGQVPNPDSFITKECPDCGPKAIKAFGCTVGALRSARQQNVPSTIKGMGIVDDAMLAMCILSDAQETMALGHTEQARQFINRAKWFLLEIKLAARDLK